jgi:amino acid transporter
MGLVSTVLGFAAVAAGFGSALGSSVPALADPGARSAASVLLVIALGFINYRGIKAGARTSDLLSVVKLLPLVVIALVGATYLRADVAAAAFTAPPGESYLSAVSAAAFLAIFMISGFEYVPIPAGEAKASERSVPRAVLWSLLGAAVLYLMLQWVALSLLPDLGAREHPLLDVGEKLFGGVGRTAVGVASVVSMAGFCAGTMLVAPLYVEALAERRWLPGWFAVRTPQGTPGRAIVVLGGVAAVLVALQDYGSLVDVANVAVFAQYLPVCVAACGGGAGAAVSSVSRRVASRPSSVRSTAIVWR